MDRKGGFGILCFIRIPHTRGDGPRNYVNTLHVTTYSPHAWGWTAERASSFKLYVVFPTRVGMDRDERASATTDRSIPHTRGDGPRVIELVNKNFYVFPTRVGMDRTRLLQR